LDSVAVKAEPAAKPVYTPPPLPKRRLGPSWLNAVKALSPLPWKRRLAKAALVVPRIRRWEKQFDKLNDAELKAASMRLRGRVRGGESLRRVLPEAFGLVCVAIKRALGLSPFDVQLAGGVALHQQAIAELATGEGKTLVAIFPTYLVALEGKGVHVTTVNDYLARRDAEWVGPAHRLLGLSVGCIQQQMPDPDRTAMYRCDITYGTASEFGFDFLRDRLKVAGNKGQEAPFWAAWVPGQSSAPSPTDVFVQRGHHFALVDEADSIFVDEARTPLVIGSPTRPATPEEAEVYVWADRVARQMQYEEHFTFDQPKQKMELTTAGKQLARWANPPVGPYEHAMDKLEERLEKSLHAHHRFRRDQHYMVDGKGKVVIVDEFTGRPMPDRHWQDGLHQAVEAKEGVPINFPTEHVAQITYQSYFRLYKKLCGMTGTAAQNRLELRRVYKRWVVCVPTNRPVKRAELSDRVFPTEDAKFDAVVAEVVRLRAEGRAVLIGTRSVDKSVELSRRLEKVGIEHQVLNARPEHAAREADIVALAGQPGRVTIATNMAGRGTDIKPPPEVLAAGGLHVLGTERHEARRIDRQLMGRSGRQGDPGSAQFLLSLEDELLEGLGPRRQERCKQVGRRGGSRDWNGLIALFLRAQRKVERRHYKARVDLMVHEKNRQEILKDLGADPYVD
jgi:preprotein translocase subunit SecA